MPDATPDLDRPPVATAATVDPFQRLHKMSTTAGLGSGDYVAINATAIASVLLGVATALVLLHDRVLLLIPLAGVACGVLAFRQIAHSNGTQTGRGLAALGLLLSLGLGGYEGGRSAVAAISARRAQAQLVAFIRTFGGEVADKRFDVAYTKCDDVFRTLVPAPAFDAKWRAAHDSALLGSLTGMDSNGLLTFDVDPLTGGQFASGMVFLRFSNSAEPLRTNFVFRQLPDGWAIDQVPDLFAQPQHASGTPTAPAGPKVYGPAKPS